MNWLRWYVGTCTDAKLHKASRLAHVRRSVVIAAWAALLEEARRNGDDGSIGDVDPSWLAGQIDEKPSTCGRVIQGMRDVRLISCDSVIAFATRQFSSDFSRDRTAKWRERHRVKSLPQHDTSTAGDGHVTMSVTHIDQNRTERDSSLRSESSSTASVDVGSEFDRIFWPRYPAKVGKKPAAAKFAQARKRHSLETIMAGLARYQHDKPADRAWLHPATFLHQERYLDEHEPQPASNGAMVGRHRPASVVEAGRAVLERFRRMEQTREDHAGPDPYADGDQGS